MIIVRVELLSAITGKTTELARMHICNEGGTYTKGNYGVETLRGRDKAALDKRSVQRSGKVTNYPRLSIHVWHLVAQINGNIFRSTEPDFNAPYRAVRDF